MTSLSKRLSNLYTHLGIERAHVLSGAIVTDALSLLEDAPGMVASQAIVCPVLLPLNASQMSEVPTLLFTGDSGPGAEQGAALAVDSHIQHEVLREFTPLVYTDTIAERRDQIQGPLFQFLEQAQANAGLPPVSGVDDSGIVDGIFYQATGSGPPVVMFPLMLAASQWSPIVDELSSAYCVIRVSGRYLSPVSNLEQSRNLPGFRRLFEMSILDAAVAPGTSVLETGSGSGTVSRFLAEKLGDTNRIVGQDINAFLVSEAEALLGEHPGISSCLSFEVGDAENLGYPDNSFGAVFSVTMLEEVDADRVLSEMVRVTIPGGCVIAIVRSLDIDVFISPGLSDNLNQKISQTIYSAGVAPQGCADSTLYQRMDNAGLTEVFGGPHYVFGLQAWLEPRLRPQLTDGEHHELDTAMRQPWFNIALPVHYGIGRKPE